MSPEVADGPVTLDPGAIARVRRLIARDGRDGAYLRLGVKGGGCSGFEYTLAIEAEPGKNDVAWAVEDVAVRVDRRALRFLQGAALVPSGNLIGGGLTFQNPNVARSCGCGTSFTPKKTLP